MIKSSPLPSFSISAIFSTRDGFLDVLFLKFYAVDQQTNNSLTKVEGAVEISWGTANQGYINQIISGTALEPRSAALADINMDGWMDFYVVYDSGGIVACWINAGHGVRSFSEVVIDAQLSSPKWVQSADFDNNGYPDAIVMYYDSEQLYIFLNYGGKVGRPPMAF